MNLEKLLKNKDQLHISQVTDIATTWFYYCLCIWHWTVLYIEHLQFF